MVTEGEDNRKESKGFAGLSSLLSEVDTLPHDGSPQISSEEGDSELSEQASTVAEPKPENRTSNEPPPPQSDSERSGAWFLWFIAFAILLFTIKECGSAKTNYGSNTSPSIAATPRNYSTSEPQDISDVEAKKGHDFTTRPSEASKTSSRPTESVPAVGHDLLLSQAQIRYCLAENIRIEGAKTVLNDYIDSDVARLNEMVDDYNMRCGSFRYKSGALAAAQQDIEPYRNQLLQDGKLRFANQASINSKATSAPSQPIPDEFVRLIQLRLNDLGYKAGPADGFMGRGTRAAIIAFQQDRGLAETGVADQALLLQLKRVSDHSTAISTTTKQPTSSSPSAQATDPASQQRSLSDGKPDLTNANVSEQASIENACNYDRQFRSSADYYNCLRRELTKLSAHSGKPDLSRGSQSEQAAIENACNYDRQYRGPGDYYSCLQRELGKLGNTAGKPSLAQATSWEQSAIENACNYDRQYRGPGDYYNCLRRELQKLASSQGKPDLSRIAQFEQASIENACNYDRQYRGPGDYYGCLRRELNKLRE